MRAMRRFSPKISACCVTTLAIFWLAAAQAMAAELAGSVQACAGARCRRDHPAECGG